MSGVTIPVAHYCKLQGYLLAKEAPADIYTALEALYQAAAQAPQAEELREAIERISFAADQLVARSKRLDKDMQIEIVHHEPIKIKMPAAAAEPDHIPDVTKVVLEQPADQQQEDPNFRQAKVKKPRNFSPEVRAAASQRMKDMQARKKAEREAAAPKASAAFELKPELDIKTVKPRPFVSPPTEEWIGMRAVDQLKDTDWPEIRAMLEKDVNLYDIAKKFNTPRPQMKDFIDRHQAEDQRQAQLFNNSKVRTIGA
jgi:hypothetical protein